MQVGAWKARYWLLEGVYARAAVVHSISLLLPRNTFQAGLRQNQYMSQVVVQHSSRQQGPPVDTSRPLSCLDNMLGRKTCNGLNCDQRDGQSGSDDQA
jgi:hypothetical protein